MTPRLSSVRQRYSNDALTRLGVFNPTGTNCITIFSIHDSASSSVHRRSPLTITKDAMSHESTGMRSRCRRHDYGDGSLPRHVSLTIYTLKCRHRLSNYRAPDWVMSEVTPKAEFGCRLLPAPVFCDAIFRRLQHSSASSAAH